MIIFLSFIIVLVFIILIARTVILSLKSTKSTDDETAKDIYIMNLQEPGSGFKTGRPENKKTIIKPKNQRNGTQDGQPQSTSTAGITGKKPKRRRYPRKNHKCFVEFIKEGRLFKETSKDISHSGMYLMSKSPEKYTVNDLLMLSFQSPEGVPQKRHGKIVRKDGNGFGVHFIKK